jgi:hypothetical protein
MYCTVTFQECQIVPIDEFENQLAIIEIVLEADLVILFGE